MTHGSLMNIVNLPPTLGYLYVNIWYHQAPVAIEHLRTERPVRTGVLAVLKDVSRQEWPPRLGSGIMRYIKMLQFSLTFKLILSYFLMIFNSSFSLIAFGR